MESGWSTHPTQFLPRSLKVNYYKLLFCLILQAIVKKGKSIQSAVILLQKGMVSSGTGGEKSGVPVQNQGFPVEKTMSPKCLGLYVSRQFIWTQTPKLCIR